MPTNFNSQAKNIIRNKWAKPIISFLSNNLDKKLVYLGLPSDEALDIKEWLEYLDVVYAFQCREYPKPSDTLQSRDKVLKLEELLREFERKKLLRTYDVFDGYLEEVILRGEDNSPDKKKFTQDDVVTIYNFDYCNSITSPIEFVDENGDVKEAYKFNAINKLMGMQSNIKITTKRFLLFLTIHCSFDDRNIQDFKTSPPNSDISNYFKKIHNFKKTQKAPFLLKAFVFHTLSQFFTANGFIPEFFPVIHYEGNSGFPLLFFTVAGTQIEQNSPGVHNPVPSISDFLSKKFISVSEEESFQNNQVLLANDERDWQNTESDVLFKKSTIITKYWG